MIIIYIISVLIGVPFGYLLVPDKFSALQSIWFIFITPIFVCCILMIVRGILEEYTNWF